MLGDLLLFAVGVAIGRWWALLVPVGVVPTFLIGVWNGWWGDSYGLDEFWPALAVGLVRGVVATALGVAVRRGAARMRASRAGAVSQK